MEKISIIIPIYNVEQFLRQCIDSVLAQTYENLEIILVNDGSTDQSSEICGFYGSRDSRIKIINKANGGLADARNAGFSEVTGNYIGFVDSDDLIDCRMYELLMETLNKSDADIAECGFRRFAAENEIPEQGEETIVPEAFDVQTALKMLMHEDLKQVVWNKLYRKEVIGGIQFEKGRIHEDEFWTYRIIARAEKIAKISNPLYYYRKQEGSIMGAQYSLKRLDGLDAREERLLFLETHFPDLFQLSLRTFWGSSSMHYQKLVKLSHLDKEGNVRKKIWNNMKKYAPKVSKAEWAIKDLFWMGFFLFAPELYAHMRNFFKVGIES